MSGCCMGWSANYCATHECPSNPKPMEASIMTATNETPVPPPAMEGTEAVDRFRLATPPKAPIDAVVERAKKIVEEYDRAMLAHESSQSDIKLAIMGNYGELAISLLRSFEALAAASQSEDGK